MRKGTPLLCLTLVLLTVAIGGCGDGTVAPLPDDPLAELKERINQSPRVNTEAELMALWISDEITAPDLVYDKINEALIRLRAHYSESIPAVRDIQFRHYFGSREIWMTLPIASDIAFDHNAFDSLNEFYHGRVLFIYQFLEVGYIHEMAFDGFLNTDSLAAAYAAISGVKYANPQTYYGDYPNIFPWILPDGTPTFLVREASGDCYAGCGLEHYWYFRVHAQEIELVGDWIPRDEPEQPSWWEEAKAARDKFLYVLDTQLGS